MELSHYRIILLVLFPLMTLCPRGNISLSAQQVRGRVIAADSKEGLVNAIVITSDNEFAITDEAGRFVLVVDSARIRVQYLGYAPLDTVILASSKETVLRLLPDNALPIVSVTASARDRFRVAGTLNRLTPDIEALANQPALGGEADILKALQLSSGISGAAEGSADILVRGGSADQNLILLDGAKMYNSNHLFGLLSPFHPEMVKSVEVFKGGFPARYGGRLSSVVDVTSADGNPERWRHKLQLGLINAQYSGNGPVGDKITLALGARTAYLTFLNLLIPKDDGIQTFTFYDLNAKLTHRTDRSNLSFFGFRNSDVTVVRPASADEPIFGRIQYGNASVGGRWLYHLTPTTDFLAEGNFNYYSFRTGERREAPSVSNSPSNIDVRSNISEWAGRIEFRSQPDKKLKVVYGAEGNVRRIIPRAATGDAPDTMIPTVEEQGRDLALYAEPSFHSGRLSSRLGIRYQQYWLPLGGRRRAFWEPRAGMEVQISDKIDASVTFARMSQGVHRITNNFVGIPNNLWVTARNDAPPATSDIYTLGGSYAAGALFVASELFYKTLNNLIDPLPGNNLFQSNTIDWIDDVSTAGSGKVHGWELNTTWTQERWSAGMAYTLSWNRARFDGINGGEWFFQQFDRRHDLAFSGAYRFNQRWSVHGNFVINSGFRLTLPKAVYFDEVLEALLPLHVGRFGEKTPTYHRMDVNFVRKVQRKSGKGNRFTVGVYNLYARANPVFIIAEPDVVVDFDQPTQPLLGYAPKLTKGTLFRFIPHVSYSFNL